MPGQSPKNSSPGATMFRSSRAAMQRGRIPGCRRSESLKSQAFCLCIGRPTAIPDMQKTSRSLILALACAGAATLAFMTQSPGEPAKAGDTAKKKIIFVAGRPSHPKGEHEHRAGCMLLADQLNKSG